MGMINPMRPNSIGNDVAVQIRQAIRERLAEYFAEFLHGFDKVPGATLEEQRFMLDVLEMWQNNRLSDQRAEELYIASAFQFTLQREAPCVIHVPEELADNVKAYLRWLQTAGADAT